VDPAPAPGGKKRPTKIEKAFLKKAKNFYVLKCWMFSFEVEGFSRSLDVLYGGLEINKVHFFIKKDFFSSKICIFGHQNHRYGSVLT
jgi:hypothetical protein